MGITYGYFLTRIQGNTNTNSLEVITGTLSLLYSDNTSEITVNNLIPIYDDTYESGAYKKVFY